MRNWAEFVTSKHNHAKVEDSLLKSWEEWISFCCSCCFTAIFTWFNFKNEVFLL